MGPFELAVENALLDEDVVVTEAAGDLWEAPKVDYWRTTDSGHRVGFKGTPGKGTPVAGNPHVLGGGKATKKKSKGKGQKKAPAFTGLPKRAGGKLAAKSRKNRAANDKKKKAKFRAKDKGWSGRQKFA